MPAISTTSGRSFANTDKNSNTISPGQKAYLEAEHRKHLRIRLGRFLLLFLFLMLWEASVRLGLLNDFIFSSPTRIVRTFFTMAEDRSIFLHTGITIGETLISFLLVTVLSAAAAVLLWKCDTLAKILEPCLVILNSLPKSALAPVLIVWLGNNIRTIIVAAVSIAVFGSIITLLTGFLETDPEKIKLIYSLGGGERDVMMKVMIPGSIPLLVSTMKVNIGLCLVGVIIGEFLAANRGLGYLIIYGSQVFKMDYVILSIVILCIVSALLYRGVGVIERKVGR